ncbi:hypothetical protein [Bradyrhizobium iriomotense]|uniref:hypothetical protein n=1 Tax=Bradyrhizobium iriomotense TaxID=441950 RepID=UPI001B8A7473|nr:hypothetical protein [Bradyrhizobium iriomotense]MBR1131699.1 hypothetical protein [Bradyrhizobium iriomotense]
MGNNPRRPLFVADAAWQRSQLPASHESGNAEAIFDADFWIWIALAFLPTVLGFLYLLFFAEV